MKTNVRFTKMQGRNDDKKFHSVAEFCRIVANDVNTDIYGYFASFYAAFIADTLQEKKRTEESQNDFIKRVMNKAYQTAKSTPTKVLKETELYKTFSSKNQLFKLVRTISPCFYDENGKHLFAKVQKVAFNASKLSTEKINDFIKVGYVSVILDIPVGKYFPNGKQITILTRCYKTESGIFDNDATLQHYYKKLSTERKQRKGKFTDLKDSAIYFFDDNENICTLVENDKMNFATLYAYVSEYAQLQNIEKVSLQQQKEKKEKFQKETIKNQFKFDAAISKTFNALLLFRNKVAKENKYQYITDENQRNLVVAGFIKLTTEYKAACQKRFADWKESENEFLKDTAKVVHALTIQPVQPKAATKKKASTKKETKKAA